MNRVNPLNPYLLLTVGATAALTAIPYSWAAASPTSPPNIFVQLLRLAVAPLVATQYGCGTACGANSVKKSGPSVAKRLAQCQPGSSCARSVEMGSMPRLSGRPGKPVGHGVMGWVGRSRCRCETA